MSPRPGGESDKFGNRYEGAWTVRQLLRVLNGELDSVTVEEVDELGEGSEFTTRKGNDSAAYQIKRQHGNANSWTVASLNGKGVLASARKHVEAGRTFYFASTIPARPIQELTERARESSDLQSFVDSYLTKDLRPIFDGLSAESIYGSAEVSWTVLRSLYIRWTDEGEMHQVNAALAGFLLNGAEPALAAVGLGDLALHSPAERLDATVIESKLKSYGLRRAPGGTDASVSRAAEDQTSAWKATVEQYVLRPEIARAETDQIRSLLEEGRQLVFAVGAGGSGKSVVLHDVVLAMAERDWTVLAFRLDRLDPFQTTIGLGKQLGLTQSPASALAKVASGRPAVLVVDQLDAVSMASGRIPQTFDIVANLVREASAFPNLHVLLACRKFDVDNDYRIRTLIDHRDTSRVDINQLSDEQVTSAVTAMGIDSASLTDRQRTILRSPLHLVLLKSVAAESPVPSFTTTTGLFDEFWHRKYMECRIDRDNPPDFDKVVRIVAEAISARQRLTVPISILGPHSLLGDANILASENVLAYTRGKREVGFFHESFFDYAFARVWIERGETLVAFLVDGEQELFRRGQVRQILTHLRGQNPSRFVDEIDALISNTSIRFHIKDVALAVLRALPDPTLAEWELLERLLEARHPFEDRLWATIRTLPWFERLDAEGVIEDWLASRDPRFETGAINLFPTVVEALPDRIAQLLQTHVGYTEHYADWLLWAVRFADLHQSRPLFDLLVNGIRTGVVKDYGHTMWMFAYELGEHQPGWAVELLAAHLVLAPGALVMDDDGKVAALLDHDHAIIRLTGQAAAGAPKMFCDLLLPYMQAVMRKTEYERDNRLLYDKHFCYRHPGGGMIHELEDALLFGAAAAIKTVVVQDPAAAKPLLDALAVDRHDAAQWLLYQGLQAAPEAYAQRAVKILLEGRERFLSGYLSNGVWAARSLIKAIGPYLSVQAFLELESYILDLRFPWERRNPGWYVFNLLSAMDEGMLSESGRRRLGELRRLHGGQEPTEPEGVTFGVVGPPIPAEAAQHMTDDQWLGAIAKHGSDREDFRARGGAHELAQVLKQATAENPLRFARLARRLTVAAHPAYGDAILDGLADADSLPYPEPVFDAIRHLANLQGTSRDGWHGSPLRRYFKTSIPDDVIQLVIDEALHAVEAPDGSEDTTSDEDRDLFTAGINTDRGKAALMLGDILIHDADGHRTALVLPFLDRLAADPSVAVRTCVAHVVTACLRHARPAAVAAFGILIRDDDRLLATQPVERLMMYLGNGGAVDLVHPLVARMLASSATDVQEAGGRLAAFAGIEWGQPDLFSSSAAHEPPAIRKGVASLCAHYLPHTADPAAASTALVASFDDADEGVREAAAQVAAQLRGRRLRPYKRLVSALISSASFEKAESQLLLTLEHAPDRVDDLAIQFAQRYIAVHGADAGNTATGAAGDARKVGQLVLRALAQASSASGRGNALDIIDQLLLLDAYGMSELVGATERSQD
jgi:hypothetical protein